MIGLELRQGFDDQCLGVIASRLRQAAYASGEVIFEYGERGDEMFLVVEGAVVVRAGPQSPVPAEKSDSAVQLAQGGDQQPESSNAGAVNLAAGPGDRIAGKGDLFGEGGLFPEALGPIRLESAKTLSFVSAFILTAAAMREIEAEYPAVRCLHRLSCSPKRVRA
jgi:CRP-like cAMP-binding protein